MADNLQQKTFSGITWTFLKLFSLEGFTFIQGIILARLLVPEDYGLIAMTQIFFAISACFIDSGFGTALIRKKNRTELDYSTVYVTNVCLTIFFALLLSLCAPWIADFYEEPILKEIVRANAILIVLNSFNAVQGTRMTINLQFKQKSIISVIVNITIGICTIIMAFMGYGVWALIYPNFLGPILYLILYHKYQHWFPKLQFSWKVWKEFFGFGSNLLLSSLLDTVFRNIYPIVIGKQFSATELGYFSKASGYAKLPATTFQGVMGQVTYPILCSIQENESRLRDAYRRLIRASAFIVFPMLMGLAALAKPFIIVLITEKWAPAIPYLQILCFAVMWYPVHVLNLNLLTVKGRSDLFLRLEIIKKVLAVCIIFISVPLGIIAMCFGEVVTSVLCLFINTYYTGKLIKVGFMKQMQDLTPTLLYALSMGALVWFVIQWIPNMLMQIIIGILVGVIYYIGIAKLTKSADLEYIIILLKENVIKRFKK